MNIGVFIILNVLNDLIAQHFSTTVNARLHDVEDVSSNFDSTILLNNKYCLDYQQVGTVFHVGKEILMEGNVKACYLMSFSSIVENQFTQKFLNVFENVTSWAKSPSVVCYNDMFYITFRIHLKLPDGPKFLKMGTSQMNVGNINAL